MGWDGVGEAEIATVATCTVQETLVYMRGLSICDREDLNC